MTELRVSNPDEDPISALLLTLRASGRIQSIDVHFARYCASQGGFGLSPAVALCAAFASAALREGHPCLPLESVRQVLLGDMEADPSLEPASSFVETAAQLEVELRASESVSSFGRDGNADARPTTPLVLDEEGRLYLTRYYDHEQELARKLAILLRDESTPLDDAWIEQRLSHHFAAPFDSEVDLQKEAARVSLRHRFSVISGGPGTGKTATVVKILALLFELAEHLQATPPEILLLAPTGKAAARMWESVQQALGALSLSPGVRERLGGEGSLGRATTVHRALGVKGNNPNRFRHDGAHPLRADVVLVDEASMMDLALMRRLVDALGPKTRLILLGDRHQLSSVQAGSVLSELCLELSRDPGRPLVELTKSFRFREDSGIATVARHVRQGEADEALSALKAGGPDLSYLSGEADAALRDEVLSHYAAALRVEASARPEDVLAHLNRFRILCAHRRGAFGVEEMNLKVRRWLADSGLVPAEGENYRGRLLLVCENDYGTGLSNGDVGLMWPNEAGRLACYFVGRTGAVRQLSPAQLPAFESAFALTVHKSQGSEHDHVSVVLPPKDSPLLTRELLYTALTRARSSVAVYGSDESVQEAVRRSVIRHSGLGGTLSRALAGASGLR